MKGIFESVLKKPGFVSDSTRWFSFLPEREQLALKVLAVFLLLVLLFYGVWKPSVNYKEEAERIFNANTELLTWMRGKEELARSLADKQETNNPTNNSILSIVDNSSKAYNITLQRYEPKRNNGIRIWLQDTRFNDLIIWLDELAVSNNIDIEQLNIDRKGNNGLVDAHIELSAL